MSKTDKNVFFRTRTFSYSMLTMGIAVATLVIVASCTGESARARVNFIFKSNPNTDVMAKIGGHDITLDELIADDRLGYFDIKKREHELKMRLLNDLVVKKLVGAEADKAGMSLEDFLKKNVTKGEIKISEAEYNKFVKEKQIPESQINPQLKDRINNYLTEEKRNEMVQTYVAKLTKNNPVEVYFEKPKMQVNIEIGQAPTWGSENAPVTIVEFSDFQCPFCTRGAETVEALKKKYGSSKLRVVFKHFPLPMHREAVPAAEASMCVNEQGSAKFWKFHDIVFKNQNKLDNDSIAGYAKQAGADEKKFKECFDSKKYASFVQSDMSYAEKMGVRSTPTFFINGQIVSGAVPIEQFSEIIDDELASRKN